MSSPPPLAVLSQDAPLTARPWLLGNVGLGLTLGAAVLAVVGVGVAVLATDRLVDAGTLDWLAGAVGPRQLHHTHRIELALLAADIWRHKEPHTQKRQER